MTCELLAANRRRIDPQVALDLLARQMWIAHSIDRGFDGLAAACDWDEDVLLTDKYEQFETMARDAIYVEMQARPDEGQPFCDRCGSVMVAAEALLRDDLAFLRAAHPSFVAVADTLVDLAADDTVSPAVYERVCEAVFTVLGAWEADRA